MIGSIGFVFGTSEKVGQQNLYGTWQKVMVIVPLNSNTGVRQLNFHSRRTEMPRMSARRHTVVVDKQTDASHLSVLTEF